MDINQSGLLLLTRLLPTVGDQIAGGWGSQEARACFAGFQNEVRSAPYRARPFPRRRCSSGIHHPPLTLALYYAETAACAFMYMIACTVAIVHTCAAVYAWMCTHDRGVASVCVGDRQLFLFLRQDVWQEAITDSIYKRLARSETLVRWIN